MLVCVPCLCGAYTHIHTHIHTHMYTCTACCISSVIASISNLNRWSSSLGLFCHVALKRDPRRLRWEIEIERHSKCNNLYIKWSYSWLLSRLLKIIGLFLQKSPVDTPNAISSTFEEKFYPSPRKFYLLQMESHLRRCSTQFEDKFCCSKGKFHLLPVEIHLRKNSAKFEKKFCWSQAAQECVNRTLFAWGPPILLRSRRDSACHK